MCQNQDQNNHDVMETEQTHPESTQVTESNLNKTTAPSPNLQETILFTQLSNESSVCKPQKSEDQHFYLIQFIRL